MANDFDYRTGQILKLLLQTSEPMTAEEISRKIKLSKRSVYYYLNKIADVIATWKIGILNVEGNAYYLTKPQKSRVQAVLNDSGATFSKERRIYYFICIVMYPQKEIQIRDHMMRFNISKNTAISDINEARKILEENKLVLKNVKKGGYSVEGEVIRKRSVLLYYLRLVFKESDMRVFERFDNDQVITYNERLSKLFRHLSVQVKREEQRALACLIYIIATSKKESYNFTIADLKNIYTSNELSMTERYFPDLSMHERVYLAIHFLGYRQTRDFIEAGMYTGEQSDLDLLDLSRSLVNRFEKMAQVAFLERDALVQSIFLHIKLTSYICSYSVQSINPLLDDIKENYSDIYEMTKKCCDDLKDRFNFPVLESEIAYLSMHFGTYLRKSKKENGKTRVLIVCPNGKTSSMFLKSEIENTFSEIEVMGVLPVHDVDQYAYDVHFVISTINLVCKYPVVQVRAILSKTDKDKIATMLKLFNQSYQSDTMQYQSIFDVIQSHVSHETFQAIKNDILKTVNLGTVNPNSNAIVQDQLDIAHVLANSEIQIIEDPKMPWETAIWATAHKMLSDGDITMGYVERMVELINQYGAYIAITDDVAIAHAQPEDGVNKLGLSLSVFPKGLQIANRHISLLFVLATPDKNIHLPLLTGIFKISNDLELLERIKNAHSKFEILALLAGLKPEEQQRIAYME